MEEHIKSNTELRSAVAKTVAHINNMCNSKDTETICSEFVQIKEILTAVFKYKIEETSN